jgi:hypothetical protein
MEEEKMARLSGSLSAAAILLAASGMATSARAVVFVPPSADWSINPTQVIMWGTSGGGRPMNGAPAGFTWGHGSATNNNAYYPVIDSNGRVYWFETFQSTPVVGSLSKPRGLFSATNSTDSMVVQNIADCNAPGWFITGTSLNPGDAAHSIPCIVANGYGPDLRVSGTNIAIGVQANGAGISESGAGQNNSIWFTGTSSGMANAAQRNDAVTLKNTSGVPTIGYINTDCKSLYINVSELNPSGTSVLPLTVPADGTNFTSTTGTGNNGFLATKSAGGGYNVVAQGGQAAPGVTGGTYYNNPSIPNNGVGDNFDRINQNGQVAYAARLNDAGSINSTNDSIAYIYTPGSTPTYSMVYRTGDTAYGIGGQAFLSNTNGNYFNLASAAQSVFSNTGLLYVAGLTGSAVTTAAGPTCNAQALYVATNATPGATGADRAANNTLVSRQGSAAPAFDITTNTTTSANMFNGWFDYNNSQAMNNSGYMCWAQQLQGSAVTIHVDPQVGETGIISAPGVEGNDFAIVVGTPGHLSMLVRQGDPAPGFAGEYFEINHSTIVIALNNANQILFTTHLTTYQTGQAVGVVGHNTVTDIDGRVVLWGWKPGLSAPFPILTNCVSGYSTGDSITVDTGVSKAVQSFLLPTNDNGNGGTLGFNDNGQAALSVVFTDGSYGVIKLSVFDPPSTCGSADFNCDGDIGTDADIQAFFECLAGTCPPPPCTGSADFNADGDIGTDADIEAFFRVLAGGSC